MHVLEGWGLVSMMVKNVSCCFSIQQVLKLQKQHNQCHHFGIYHMVIKEGWGKEREQKERGEKRFVNN